MGGEPTKKVDVTSNPSKSPLFGKKWERKSVVLSDAESVGSGVEERGKGGNQRGRRTGGGGGCGTLWGIQLRLIGKKARKERYKKGGKEVSCTLSQFEGSAEKATTHNVGGYSNFHSRM